MSKFIYILIALIYLRYCKCSDQTSCDFETDFCGYEHNEYFVRYTGKSPSVSSGPSFDHTYGDGWYGLCDGSRLRDPKEKCLLRKEVTIEADSKFDFWYYMFGFQLGTLELIANGEVVWSKTDRQQDGWLFAQVSLERGTYELLFSGNRSEAGRVSSDIAIDDLMLEGQILTTNIVTSPRTSAEPALDISDNFDSGVPTWTTEYTIAQWSVVNGNTSDFVGSYGPASDYSSLFSNVNLMTDEEGPSCEIPFSLENDPLKPLYFCQNLFLTIGTRRNYTLVCGGNPFAIPSPQSTFIRCNRGNYLMTTNERFDNPLGIFRSRLFSPVFTVPADVELFCFSFRYHIRSSDTDGFKVAIENYLDHEEVQTLSTVTGQSAIDRWYLASIEITSRYEQNRIFIEPIRGTNKEFASISIDSISVNYGICDPEPTKTTATTTTSTTTTSTTTTSITTTTITETTSTPETETENTSHLISTSGNIDSTTTSEHSDESTLPSATSDHSDESTITSTSTTSTTTTTGVSSSTPRSSSTSRTTASTATTTTTIFREDEKKEDKDDTLAIVLGILIPVIVLSILGGAFYYFWKTGKIGKCGKDENANQDNESVKYVARTDFVDIHDNKNNELYPPIDDGSLKPGQK